MTNNEKETFNHLMNQVKEAWERSNLNTIICLSQEGVRQYPWSGELWRDLAKAIQKRDKSLCNFIKLALPETDKWLTKNSFFAGPFYYLAKGLLESHQYEQALEYAKKSEDCAMSGNKSLYIKWARSILAKAHAELGHHSEAVKIFSKVFSVTEKDNKLALTTLLKDVRELRNAMTAKKEWKVAQQYSEIVVKYAHHPLNDEDVFYHINNLDMAAENTSTSLISAFIDRYLDDIKSLSNGSKYLSEILGLAVKSYCKINRKVDAESILSLFDLSEFPELLRLHGCLLSDLEQYQRALPLLEQASHFYENVNDPDFLWHIGQTYANLGIKLEEACIYFEKASILKKDNMRCKHEHIRVLERLNKWREAVSLAETLLKENNNDKVALISIIKGRAHNVNSINMETIVEFIDKLFEAGVKPEKLCSLIEELQKNFRLCSQEYSILQELKIDLYEETNNFKDAFLHILLWAMELRDNSKDDAFKKWGELLRRASFLVEMDWASNKDRKDLEDQLQAWRDCLNKNKPYNDLQENKAFQELDPGRPRPNLQKYRLLIIC